ncbi:hypothetical protein HHK36_012681 [Tetracentron sinense]|uniref:NAB domain-containing protein n=1 Tax=Tetracentron sinense TaxID=13715 RepID=A0A834Z794_TETSI|nr:hypothetical protein HHK36_012681 [Tetracentron sinense]
MATLTHAESRRLYSWWWDSHISPKNSKWLQENLTDMDAKVKAMIKLIEEDADSFARRAEMYYKKRPELMKLVEEFYRAYRALAERYDHATGELRQAHRTMAEAFPNRLPFVLADDSPSGSTTEAEPSTPKMPHPIRSLFNPDDLHKDALGLLSSHFHAVNRNGAYTQESDSVRSKKGMKQLNDMFGSGEVASHHVKFEEGKVRKRLNFDKAEEEEQNLKDGVSQLSRENPNLETWVLSESEGAGKAETKVQTLNEALAKLEVEKEAGLLQYQQNLERLSNLETEVSRAQEDAKGFNDRASKSEIEVQALKAALTKLEGEREADLLQYQQCLDRISNLEKTISQAEEDARKHDKRTSKSEIEAQILKQTLTRLEAEKEVGLLQYKQCLETISNLENKILCAEEDTKRLNERADRAESKVETLKQALTVLTEEKEAVALRYQQCLEKISDLETEISRTQEEAKRLNDEKMMGVAKLNSAEEQCLLLERSNKSLKSEVDNLVQKTGMQNQELSEKQQEWERLRICMQEDRLRFAHAETTLQTLQKLHSQSQEEQRALALELQHGIQMLKDMELRNQDLEDDIRRIKEENKSLNELNLSSAMSMNNLQDEIFSIREIKRKLEEDIELRVDQRNALQQEIYCLKEEINDLNRKHRAILEQVDSVGLKPESLGSSVKYLQDENSKLKEICQKDRDEKVALLGKLEILDKLLDKNVLLENTLSDVNAELEGLREKVKALEESWQALLGEKSTLVAQKANLVSQLEIIAENMKKVSEKNTLLENSLCEANVELEKLREKSKSLEESSQMLDNEKSGLLVERDTLVSQLDSILRRLKDLERRYTTLEENYFGLEKEKESTVRQVEELWVSLDVEKQERASFTQSNEARLVGMENQIILLQEEGRWRKKEFEEELDNAMNAQVEIFILQKCIREMEEKNLSLLIESQKYSKVSKLTKKLISELERENMEQQVEVKSLLGQIEKLRTGIHLVLKALEIDPDYGCDDKIEQDHILLQHVLGNIEDTKSSLLKTQDQKMQLVVEKSILVTLLGQLKLEVADVVADRNTLDQEFKIRTEQMSVLQIEKHDLLEMNGKLRLEVREGDNREEVLKAEMENQHAKLMDLQESYLVLRKESSEVFEENRFLMEEFSDLKEEICTLEAENSVILGEAIALRNLSLIFKSFSTEKAMELKGLNEDLNCLRGVNSGLEKRVRMLGDRFEMVQMENSHLKESVGKLENEMDRVRNIRDELNYRIEIGKDLLNQKEMELSEAERMVKATQAEKSELHRNVEGLKRRYDEAKVISEDLEKQILELSEVNKRQNNEIGCLCEANMRFESELGELHEKYEELKTREENLSCELQERSNEVELWEAEAATFYSDLQLSSIREGLLEEKVCELTGACERFEEESTSKSVDIEYMKERVCILESENGGLKAQLAAYFPVIVSLRDSITSLEHHALSQTNMAYNQEARDADLVVHLHDNSCQGLSEDQSAVVPDAVSDLQVLQTRIKAVEKAVLEMDRHVMQESLNSNIKLEAAIKQMEELKSKRSLHREIDVQTSMDIVMQLEDELRDDISKDLKLQRTEPEISKTRNAFLMKDIPLDQVSDYSSFAVSRRKNGEGDDQILELWKAAEQDCSFDPTANKAQQLASASTENDIVYRMEVIGQKSESPSSKSLVEKELGVDKLEISRKVTEPHQERNKRKILDRLVSDSQKLTNLQITVQDLKKKTEISANSQKTKGTEYDTVKAQLQEVEEAIMQLADINGKLTKSVEESPSSSDGKAEAGEDSGKVRRRRVSERARRGSEKIGRLQLEVQKIQFVLLRLGDEKESKGKSRINERGTKIILQDYLYSSGRTNHQKRKKDPFCACVRPPTKGD